MLRINIFIVAFLLIPGSFSLYNEKYRPQFHFSPPTGWINDPNGFIYIRGQYHLFFQYNPYENVAANIHWGHAVSPDLIHWKNLPVALYPTDGNAIWSGTTIIDRSNVTGLQKKKNVETLLAVFTAHNMNTSEENQWMAYSNVDNTYENFRIYPKNPIIRNPNPSVQIDFRDPAVFKYKSHYVIVLAAHDRIKIYNSKNLLKWKLVSEFKIYTDGRTWECPSLFPINVIIDGVQVEKWVLTFSLAGDALPVTRYVTGSFDGKTFKKDSSEATWVDYGPDSYAGIILNNGPNGRRTFISWMNKWEYGPSLNLSVWNGQMGLPRDLTLKQYGDRLLLSSLPVREIETLRNESVQLQNVLFGNDFIYKFYKNGNEGKKHLLDIEMSLDLSNINKRDSFDIVFSGLKDYLKISFNGSEVTLDRSHAGNVDFPNFAGPFKANRLIDCPDLKLRMLLDRSSIELFIDDGLTILTALFFSDENLASKMAVQINSYEKNSSILIKEFNVYRLQTTWNQYHNDE